MSTANWRYLLLKQGWGILLGFAWKQGTSLRQTEAAEVFVLKKKAGSQ
jgi:hypothetical protein